MGWTEKGHSASPINKLPKEKKNFGPKNLETGSRPFRIEYAVISLAILGYSIWLAVYGQGLDILQFIFWGIFPDLVAFIPIGLAMKKSKKRM